ncbi:MAG: hypothetical protein LBG66_03635 [Gallionellaceae bacterium]|jgi:hypothetical protein|nr:hypothetical protein [Gallionellaceae bacterium]
MRIELKIVKWGNGFAIRMPTTLLEEMEAQVGDTAVAEVFKGLLMLHFGEAIKELPPADPDASPELVAIDRVLHSTADEALDQIATVLDRS